MTNNIRVFLWLALALGVWVNYTQWQHDYAPKPETAAVETGATGGTKPHALSDSVPQVVQTAPAPTTTPGATPAPIEPGTAAAPQSETEVGTRKIRVTTDVLTVDVSVLGGSLVRAELPAYPQVKGEAAPVVLLNTDSPATNYVLQSGLTNPKDADRPTHRAVFTSASDSYSLAPGQNELRVPLSWTDGKGVTVTKTYVFERSLYRIGLEYRIDNATQAPWQAASYTQISRTDPPVERSMFKVESFATRCPAIYDGTKYRKLKIEKPEDSALSIDVTHGWIAGMQHHFVSAVVPDPAKPYHFTLQVNGREYLLSAVGQLQTVAPGATATFKETLFVGPKLQAQLDQTHPELSRVADYGVLTLLSKPLFAMLEIAHSVVRNWGLSIILVTFLLKLLFYPLAQYSGKSMARMRNLTPRMKALQETYKDDREKLGRATMELYKAEKVNPLSGCLPMFIQMPVFLAFYWVLLESVEMRQAPFFGWINDLSARDPFFILPALNGLAMWFQYKLNPPPPDPMQAKVFQFMPLVFSVMFALFPAGLVLYWVTNTGLSILQQWNINRHIAELDKARRK
jgi:YidC/Oxa1 family membrane protein insertase